MHPYKSANVTSNDRFDSGRGAITFSDVFELPWRCKSQKINKSQLKKPLSNTPQLPAATLSGLERFLSKQLLPTAPISMMHKQVVYQNVGSFVFSQTIFLVLLQDKRFSLKRVRIQGSNTSYCRFSMLMFCQDVVKKRNNDFLLVFLR